MAKGTRDRFRAASARLWTRCLRSETAPLKRRSALAFRTPTAPRSACAGPPRRRRVTCGTRKMASAYSTPQPSRPIEQKNGAPAVPCTPSLMALSLR